MYFKLYSPICWVFIFTRTFVMSSYSFSMVRGGALEASKTGFRHPEEPKLAKIRFTRSFPDCWIGR
jgi:hypothetical protein